LAFGGVDKTVQVVDRASGQSWRKFPSGGLIAGLAFSPDSQTLGVVSEPPGPCLRLWDLATKQERTPPDPARHRFGIAFHPAGDRVLTGSADGIARLWETAPGTGGNRDFDFSKVRPVGVGGVAFAPSGRHFAVGLANGAIAVFATPPAAAR
jgi:WD40 repeat protein